MRKPLRSVPNRIPSGACSGEAALRCNCNWVRGPEGNLARAGWSGCCADIAGRDACPASCWSPCPARPAPRSVRSRNPEGPPPHRSGRSSRRSRGRIPSRRGRCRADHRESEFAPARRQLRRRRRPGSRRGLPMRARRPRQHRHRRRELRARHPEVDHGLAARREHALAGRVVLHAQPVLGRLLPRLNGRAGSFRRADVVNRLRIGRKVSRRLEPKAGTPRWGVGRRLASAFDLLMFARIRIGFLVPSVLVAAPFRTFARGCVLWVGLTGVWILPGRIEQSETDFQYASKIFQALLARRRGAAARPLDQTSTTGEFLA